MNDGILKKELEEDEKIKELKKKNLISKYYIRYDSFMQSLEPLYFWTLDFVKKLGYNVEKVNESMAASVTSAFFGEMSARRMQLEKRGMEILGTINVIIKSIINLLYDLKELDRRLKVCDDFHSNDKSKAEAADYALKRIWMDEVDINKGNASIAVMSTKLEFVTLRDALMAAKKPDDIENMDLNKRVKRIAESRLEEYLHWRDAYEKDLRQRKKIELSYLKSQVDSLKLYARWAGPYLKAAQMIGFKDIKRKSPELIQAFDQSMINLTIRGYKTAFYYQAKLTPEGLPIKIKVPPQLKGKKRDNWIRLNMGPKAYAVIEVNFDYKTKPVNVGYPGKGMYRFSGVCDIYFNGYAFSEEDFKELNHLEDEEALKFIEGLATESLGTLREDLEKYLNEFEGKEVKIEEKKEIKTKPKKEVKNRRRILTGKEKIAYDLAKTKAAEDIYTVFDIFKVAHGLNSFGLKIPPKPDIFTEEFK